MRRVLSIGPLWRGSNAGGLFRALSREGCLIEVVDEFYFVSLQTKTKLTKILERAIRPMQETEFNNAIKNKVNIFKPDVLLVYKGVFVRPETLTYARANGCKLMLFYPDVSMTAHGKNIPNSIPLYDLVFTTKTFGIRDMEEKYGVKNTFFIPHGFDPDIHRQLEISEQEQAIFGCDASFIGTWSLKKEKWLAHLKESIPELKLRIWGDQWNKTTADSLKSSVQGRSVVGDLYALAIQCSKINLGILSEQVSGASSGDLITSRTFHITAASGFMLHERNEESVLYYKEDIEAGFFDGPEELVEKVKKYLHDDAAREKIRIAGHKRALADHSLDARARVIINRMKQL
jgi:glycosyltransferase involved in cell wall biosynthesis